MSLRPRQCDPIKELSPSWPSTLPVSGTMLEGHTEAHGQEHTLLDSLTKVQMCRKFLLLQPPLATTEDLRPSIFQGGEGE